MAQLGAEDKVLDEMFKVYPTRQPIVDQRGRYGHDTIIWQRLSNGDVVGRCVACKELGSLGDFSKICVARFE